MEKACVAINSGTINPLKSDGAATVYEYQNTEDVVRGVKSCPKYEEKRSDYHHCKPVKGVPYRNGIYAIQAFNGMYLFHWTQQGTLAAKPLTYYDMYHADYPLVGRAQLTDREALWVLHFHVDATDPDDLEKHYFLIQSGKYNRDDPAGGSQKLQYLTMFKHNNKIILRPIDGRPTDGQKWFMEPARSSQGFMDVRIYTKIGGQKYYWMSKDNRYPEYHEKIMPGPSTGAHPHDVFTKYYDESWFTVSRDTKVYQEIIDAKKAVQQYFRILECDYGLDNGQQFMGVKRRIPKGKGESYGDFGETLKREIGWPAMKKGYSFPQAEELLLKYLGITNARFHQMFINTHAVVGSDQNGHLFHLIGEALKESDSIYDYAGRMRIRAPEFKVMRDNIGDLIRTSGQDRRTRFMYNYFQPRIQADGFF